MEDLLESVIVWNEARVFGDTPGSLRECIQTFRCSLSDGAGRPRPMIGVLEELGVRDAFDVRATRETSDCLVNHIAMEYAAYHRVETELVYEMFCFVIFGLVGLMKMNSQIEDDVLMRAIKQALRLDMVLLEAGGGACSMSIHRQSRSSACAVRAFTVWRLASAAFTRLANRCEREAGLPLCPYRHCRSCLR